MNRHSSKPLNVSADVPCTRGDEPALQQAIERVGGQRELGRRLGVSYQAIQTWLQSQVPAERVLTIERLTGVSRHALRPDIYPRDGK
jgi:DNA-binding transcriptional regulator YdaS (Cro superfamily)